MIETEIPHPDLLSEIDDFCAANNMKRSAFGKEALHDPRFVFDLEAGRECRRATIKRVRDFMAGASK